MIENSSDKSHCLICGKEISSKRKFCSSKCYGISLIRYLGPYPCCPICGKEMKRNQSFCSYECHGISMLGDGNPSWKEGRTKESSAWRRRYRRKMWNITRERILKRDNYTCQHCGQKNIILNIHHITKSNIKPELFYEDDNLITLCVDCHSSTHLGKGINIWKKQKSKFQKQIYLSI